MEVKKIVCDCCGGDNAHRYETLALHRIEHTEGRLLGKGKEYVSVISVDLCDECKKRATNLEDVSASCVGFRFTNSTNDELRDRIRMWVRDELSQFIRIDNSSILIDKEKCINSLIDFLYLRKDYK